MVKKVGIIGLGTVGEATLESIKRYCLLVEKRTSLKIKVEKICDICPEKKKLGDLFSLPFTTDPYEIINDPHIDIVVELIGGINPAKEYLIHSLKKGKDVVTANKALLAAWGEQLFEVAGKYKRAIGCEASVGGAIPLIKSISQGLVGCEVEKLYGILNGTTNYILYKMHKEGTTFSLALKQAQEKGFAEKKPDLDIEGKDTLHKLCILTYLCFGVWPPLKSLYVEGISQISPLDITYAEELNYRIKLLAVAKREKDGLDLRVHPTLINKDHPLAEVPLVFNAIWVEAEPSGELLFFGKGAGGTPTSSAIISDIVSVSFNNVRFIPTQEKIAIKSINDLRTRYYIRFMAVDKPGVLAEISKILASYNISIASVTQKERGKERFVPIVMITHEAKEADLKKAVVKIDKLPVIKPPSQLIRIESL